MGFKANPETVTGEPALNVVGYIRVSTDEQVSSGLSLDNQRARIYAYCAAVDMNVTHIIEDSGKSGKSLARPGMEHLLDIVRKQRTDGVVILKLDRLTRNVRDLSELIELFEEKGVALMAVQESINTATAAGRLMANVLGSVAQWEREIISERTRSAMAVKRARGEKCGGYAPYGFDEGPNTRLLVNVKEQAVIQEMRYLRHECDMSWRAIAREMNSRGLLSKLGRPWKPFAVQRTVERTSWDKLAKQQMEEKERKRR